MTTEMLNKNSLKENNKGFSLVEVIVAMSILVIVSIPLLSSISSSFVINRNAKQHQRGNNISQNIVESCKSYGAYDVRKQFKTYGENGQAADLKIIDGYSFDSASEYTIDGDGDFQANTTNGDMEENYFIIRNLQDGANAYDVLITTKLKEPITQSESIVNLSGSNVAVIDNFGNTAVSDGGSNYYEKAIEVIKQNVPTVTDADLAEMIKCTLTVEVDETATGVEIAANANYTTVAPVVGYSLNETYLVSFYNLQNPEYIYLLYTPCSGSDEVSIVYNIDKKVDLFIVPTSYDSVTWPANFELDILSARNIGEIMNIHASSTNAIRNYASLTSFITNFESINNSLYDIKVQTYQHATDADDMFTTRLISTFDSTIFGKN